MCMGEDTPLKPACAHGRGARVCGRAVAGAGMSARAHLQGARTYNRSTAYADRMMAPDPDLSPLKVSLEI